MPDALLRNCANYPACGNLVPRGRCPTCETARDLRRGTSAERGYDAAWRRFRQALMSRMIQLGILPVCGAALPGGPEMRNSACKLAGRLNDQDLHFDHDPPLRPEERGSQRAICDPRRVGILCGSCHSAKTAREMREGLV